MNNMIYLPIFMNHPTPIGLLGDLAAIPVKVAAIMGETLDYVSNKIISVSDNDCRSYLCDWYNMGCCIWQEVLTDEQIKNIVQYCKEVGIIYIYNPVCGYIICEPVPRDEIRRIKEWVE
jgi:hypothetical protein